MERKVFVLFHPFDSDKGDKLTEINARLLTLGENIEIVDATDDELLQDDRMICAITGLTSGELDRLSVPDYNSLHAYLFDQRTQGTAEFLGKELDPDKPDLLQPITANGGQAVESINLQVPSLKSVRLRDKVKGGDIDRALWMTSHCTGLGVSDLRGLCMPDWMQLQKRLGDFLLQPAGYFQSGTSDT